MMNEPTAGPWHWVNDDTDEPWHGECDHASLQTVKIYHDESGVWDNYPNIANRPKFIISYAEGFSSPEDAALIAAAPEQQAKIDMLLIACKETINFVNLLVTDGLLSDLKMDILIAKLQSAIAKIEAGK